MPGELRSYEQSYLNEHLCRLAYSIKLISKVIPRGSVILDVGSHAGYVSIILKLIGYNVVALDKWRPEFKFWKRRYEEFGVELIFHDLTSGEDIPIDNVDAALMLEVIEHIPSHPHFILRKVNRALRMGGLLVLSTPNALSLSRRVSMVLGREPTPIYRFDVETSKGHFREYSAREIVYLLRMSGFAPLHINIVDRDDLCRGVNINVNGRLGIKFKLLRTLFVSLVKQGFIEGPLEDMVIVVARKVTS